MGAAIKDIDGLRVEKLAAGELVATVDSDEVKEELIAAIEKAGYKVGNDHNKTSATSGGCCSRWKENPISGTVINRPFLFGKRVLTKSIATEQMKNYF